MIATVIFPGDESEYDVGAEVTYCSDPWACGYEVEEPDVSAPNCDLSLSSLIDHDSLPKGWSIVAEEALVEAYEGAMSDMTDSRADYEYDRDREDW